jgi:hypothetical protein
MRRSEEEERPAPDRLAELPQEIRKFLAALREDDIQTLKWIIKAFQTAEAVAVVCKWLLLAMIVMLVMAAQIGDSISKLWHWLTGR